MVTPIGAGERILVVDDEEAIRALLADYLATQGFTTESAAGGKDALHFLAQTPFDLIVSDLRMPGMDGLELLGDVVRRYPETGVVMLTGCEDVGMAVTAMKAGALDYVLKPFRMDEVALTVRRALDRRAEILRRNEHLRELEEAVQRQGAELRRVLNHLEEASEVTLDALVAALDAREHETKAHSKRVGEYTVHLAQRMGMRGADLETVRRGAMLHDIGKIGIPDRILLKPGRLTDAEWREMRRHPQIGYWILSGVERLRPAADIVLSHHERYGGGGYPRGLRGDRIPPGARIFAVADSLDAMTSDRPYHRGVSWQAARDEIALHTGTQFDPAVVAEFLRVPLEAWAAIRERTLAEPAGSDFEIAPLVLS